MRCLHNRHLMRGAHVSAAIVALHNRSRLA